MLQKGNYVFQNQRILLYISKLTLGSPSSQRAVVIDDVAKGQGQDEEGAVAGSVHLEGHVPLIQTNRLSFLRQ